MRPGDIDRYANRLDSAAFDESGEPFRLTITVYPVDRNRFVVNVGNVPPGVSGQTG